MPSGERKGHGNWERGERSGRPTGMPPRSVTPNTPPACSWKFRSSRSLRRSPQSPLHPQEVTPHCLRSPLLTTKRNEVLTHATTWMNLKTLHDGNEASHGRPRMVCSFYTHCPEQANPEREERQASGHRRQAVMPKGRGFLFRVMRMFWNRLWFHTPENMLEALSYTVSRAPCVKCALHLNRAVIEDIKSDSSLCYADYFFFKGMT